MFHVYLQVEEASRAGSDVVGACDADDHAFLAVLRLVFFRKGVKKTEGRSSCAA